MPLQSWELEKALYFVPAICAAIFQICLPFRLRKLAQSVPRPVTGSSIRFSTVLALLLSGILLASSIFLHLQPAPLISVLASSVPALGLSVLLLLEHERSSKPSDLAVIYLTVVIVCDTVLLTMPGPSAQLFPHPILIIRLLIYTMLLLVECCSARVGLALTEPQQSPEELSSLFSKAFFFWVNRFLFQEFDSILILRSLPILSRENQPKTMRQIAMHMWARRAKSEKRTTLPLTLLKCLQKSFIIAIIPRLLLIVFKYSQPRLIRAVILFVDNDYAGLDRSHGYWLVVSAAAIYVGIAVCAKHPVSVAAYQHRLNKLKLMTKSMLIGLIHDKALDMPSIAYDNGAATTLMSNEVDLLNQNVEVFHETWAYLLEVVIGVVLLAKQIGWIWPLPLLLVFMFSGLGTYVTRDLHRAQKDWNQSTQARVAATSSMISSIKVVKMLGLQKALSIRIEQLREKEMEFAAKVRWMMVYYNACANSLGIFSPAITLVVFALLALAHGQSMDTAAAFTSIAILNLIMHPAAMVLNVVPRATAAFACFDRIQTFLLQPSLVDDRGPITALSSNDFRRDSLKMGGSCSSWALNKPGLAIIVHQVTVGVLQNHVSIQLARGTFTMVSGPVGSGKSTLLRALLGEIMPDRGSISLSTRRIAYCAQTPWLPGGTIRRIIRGTSKERDGRWYQKVVEACCLTHEFSTLPDGDLTQIGSRGLNLSGGQIQRVSLARAVFARCEIVLLDDSFSALDGDTEKAIFNNLLGPAGLFRQLQTTVVLAANASQYFPTTDHVMILGNNGLREQGAWQSITAESAAIRKFELQKGLQKSLSEQPAASDQLGTKEYSKEIECYQGRGDITLYGYYFKFTGLTNLGLLMSWAAAYAVFVSMPQVWLQFWTESEGDDTWYYIAGFLVLCFCALVSTHGTIWSAVIKIAPHSGLQVHRRLLNIVTKLAFPFHYPKWHYIRSRLTLPLSAPLSYFSAVEIGSILNRFSQDIQYVDQQLPLILANVSNQIFKLSTQAVILFMSQKLLALTLPASLFIVYALQTVYMKTSRQLQLLELESRAAVFSSFLESIEGLATIRAFGWRQHIVRENVENLHVSQRAEFLRLSLQRWLNVVLDLISAAMVVLVIVILTAYRHDISGGQAGVIMNIMLVANGTLLKLVDGWTTLELALGSMSRVRSLEKSTASEPMTNNVNFRPERSWPSNGEVIFQGATATYQSGAIALDDVSLSIEAGKKVVIHGRTGSGKSSLLLSLLRMIDLQSGRIELDGIDISTVSPEILRQRCFVTVSQDALLLSNETLRFNLDAENSLSDDCIIEKLARFGLLSQLGGGETNSMNEHGDEWKSESNGSTETTVSAKHLVLDEKVANLPEFSIGQRQLLALCRALITLDSLRLAHIRPVILMDEPTSSLDTVTESHILGIVDEELIGRGHTVIMITHRLDGVADRASKDIVVSMADGKLRQINLSSNTQAR